MKRTRFIATLAALSIPLAANANLLDDGNFDLPTGGTQTSNSAWSLTSNVPDGTNVSATFQASGFARSGGAAGAGAGVWFKSFEGNQGGAGDPLATALLTQSVVAPISGDYLLTFEAAREVNFTATQLDVSLSSSGSGGSGVVDLITASIPVGNFNQVQVVNGGPGAAAFSIQLNGVTAGDTLTVSATLGGGADSQIPGGQSAFIDSFNLAAIPEPASASVVAVGLLAIARRRRRAC